MGGKASKAEAKHSKGLSSIGRSSQRNLFQKSKSKLGQINKTLEDGSVAFEDIQKEFECVEKELNSVSAILKEKHKHKYEDAMAFLENTRTKIENKRKSITEIEEIELKSEDVVQTPVDDDAIAATENKELADESEREEDIGLEAPKSSKIEFEDQPLKINDNQARASVEIRKPIVPPKSPKVKFGIQVMPIDARTSRELLKRKTLPANDAPRAEFEKIREGLESGNSSPVPSPTSISAPVSPPAPDQNGLKLSGLQDLESIGVEIDTMESDLKYFTGLKSDYIVFHRRFVNSLMRVDNVESDGEPVLKQEKKILTHRIEELMKILECLVEQSNVTSTIEEMYDMKQTFRKEADINAEGKTVAATAI